MTEKQKETNFYKFFKEYIEHRTSVLIDDARDNYDDEQRVLKYENISEEDIDEIINDLMCDGDLENDISNAIDWYINKILGVE